MRKKLGDLAKLVDGELLGDFDLMIKGVAAIEDAKDGDLAFALEPKAINTADSSKASALIAPLKTKPKKPGILVKNPRLAMAKILEIFKPPQTPQKGIHKTAVISKTARIGKNPSIGANTVVGEDVEIGDNCVIYPNVSIYPRVKIGSSVVLHSGAVIGVDGFGFVQEGGRHVKIPQIGSVVIEDDVEIYSNTCVARGAIGNTIIKRGTKIDNLTHIAHNCVIGEDCAITALVGFAGSVTFGDRVYVGGQAGFSGHINIGENTIVMAKSGVTKDIPKNLVVSGFPAQEHKKELEIQALIRRLPQFFKSLLKK